MNRNYTKNTKKPFSINLRTKTLAIIAIATIIIATVLFSSFFIPSQLNTNFAFANQPPSLQHLFGTDWMGRDMFTRTIKGLSISIGVGAFAAIVSTIMAIVLGLLSSLNKFTDEIVVGIIDLFNSVPHILLIILISMLVGEVFMVL